MLRISIFFPSILLANSLFAANAVDLYHAPLSSIQKLPIAPGLYNFANPQSAAAGKGTMLQQVNQSASGDETIVRYQQFYNGIPVIGSQAIVIKNKNQNTSVVDRTQVNGHLVNNIQLNTKAAISKLRALAIAKKAYFSTHAANPLSDTVVALQIREGANNSLNLAYLVSFKSIDEQGKPVWPHAVINAQTGAIILLWNNIKNYGDYGPGGNVKVKKYWYGKNGLPLLPVTKAGTLCIMESSSVKVINLKYKWDWNETLKTPYRYVCRKNVGDPINGAYSPINDAYYFGHLVVGMYRNWYGLNALQNAKGKAIKLVMRVHFGRQYDNAFWDGVSMTFGDGDQLYPLVSVDVAGHEVTHGFTEQHSGLEYHDQPGSINESFSDMGGQATRAYLLGGARHLYNAAYVLDNRITWGIGETIVPASYGTALRFMNSPSNDQLSADCYNKSLATANGASCYITYGQVVAKAKAYYRDAYDQQGFIVHTGSGVFNKAFYLLSAKYGIRTSYRIMLIANSKYWTPNASFVGAACGVLHATKDLKLSTIVVKKVFNQVGVSTTSCKL